MQQLAVLLPITKSMFVRGHECLIPTKVVLAALRARPPQVHTTISCDLRSLPLHGARDVECGRAELALEHGQSTLLAAVPTAWSQAKQNTTDKRLFLQFTVCVSC